MYIVAMWLRSPKSQDEGVNVVIYKHPTGLPHDGDLNKIIEDPGKEEGVIRYDELPRGGNRIQAALDLVLEDRDYDRNAILRALAEFEENQLGTHVLRHPLASVPLNDGRMRGVFATNLGPMDPQSARAVFSLLSGTIAKALAKRHDQIAA